MITVQSSYLGAFQQAHLYQQYDQLCTARCTQIWQNQIATRSQPSRDLGYFLYYTAYLLQVWGK